MRVFHTAKAGGRRLRSLLLPRFDQDISTIRLSRLPYMLIFSLAPVFANMQEGVLGGYPSLMGIDPMSLMGIAYCLGGGLLFAFARLDSLHRYARALSAVMAAFYALWLVLLPGTFSLLVGFFFLFALGGCAGIAAFAFAYALNKAERLLGAALISLFYMLWQLDFSYRLLSGVFPQAYLSALVVGTAFCLGRYKAQDYQEAAHGGQTRPNLPLALMLLFFFSHKVIEVFYTYLPGASAMEALRVNAWMGILVFVLSLFLYFKARFSLWYMCNLFFIGMLAAVTLPIACPGPRGCGASRFLHSFEQMGFIASYCMLGGILKRNAGFRLFKWLIFIALNFAILIYMIPGLIAARDPESLPLTAALVTGAAFLAFILLSPVYAKHIFSPGEPEPAPAGEEPIGASPDRLEEFMNAKGLTLRERDLLPLLLEGLMHKECAEKLDISVDTVKFHAKNLYRKLGVNGRSQLFSALYSQAAEEDETPPVS